MSRPFLDYYKKHNIVPVRQEISDLSAHFWRRNALFLQVGLVPSWLRDKAIIEFGPGSGDNAVHLASLGPSNYVLVDANPASLEEIQKKIHLGLIPKQGVDVRNAEIETFKDDRRFDFVLCEGVISGQKKPDSFALKVASFTAPGGVFMFTTTSFVSIFPEVCRRMAKPIFAGRFPIFEDLVSHLTDFFKPDLDTLIGMSRRRSDWVMDMIMQPFAGSSCWFSIPDAVRTLGDQFDFQGSSPRFFSDWRWYKKMTGPNPGFNDILVEQYHALSSTLLDYRQDPGQQGYVNGKILEEICVRAFDIHNSIWQEDLVDRLPEFFESVVEVADLVAPVMPATAKALNDYLQGMTQLIHGNDVADFGSFRELWGRGQQYVAFVRSQDRNRSDPSVDLSSSSTSKQ